jgi:mannosyltransferase OCH1-like enzyme
MIFLIQNNIYIFFNEFKDNFIINGIYKSSNHIKLYIERIDNQDWKQELQIIIFSIDKNEYEIIDIENSDKNIKIIEKKLSKIKLVPKTIFISPSEIPNISDNEIPKFIHRTLLYDDNFPLNAINYLEYFIFKHPNFTYILWRNEDILEILQDKPNQLQIYKQFKNIQKSDFARYLILQKYGGMYVDFDIKIFKSLDLLFDLYKNQDSIIFVEHIHNNNNKRIQSHMYIRNGTLEDTIRIANYLIISKPNSDYINKIIELLISRSQLPIKNSYDIIYTTGPDLTSTIYAQNPNLSTIINKSISDSYFSHDCFGHWKIHYSSNNDIKIIKNNLLKRKIRI